MGQAGRHEISQSVLSASHQIETAFANGLDRLQRNGHCQTSATAEVRCDVNLPTVVACRRSRAPLSIVCSFLLLAFIHLALVSSS
jgi:hypothetical protein